MEKKYQDRVVKHKVPHKKAEMTPVAEQVLADEVERVLEHVSSPYRWELLETPQTHPKAPAPEKSPKLKPSTHLAGDK